VLIHLKFFKNIDIGQKSNTQFFKQCMDSWIKRTVAPDFLTLFFHKLTVVYLEVKNSVLFYNNIQFHDIKVIYKKRSKIYNVK